MGALRRVVGVVSVREEDDEDKLETLDNERSMLGTLLTPLARCLL